MIARLTGDTELDLPAESDAGTPLRCSDTAVSAGRRESWQHRGRSQVVFNGPPADKSAPAACAAQHDPASN